VALFVHQDVSGVAETIFFSGWVVETIFSLICSISEHVFLLVESLTLDVLPMLRRNGQLLQDVCIAYCHQGDRGLQALTLQNGWAFWLAVLVASVCVDINKTQVNLLE